MASSKPVYSNLYSITGYPGDVSLGLNSTLPLLFETSLVTGGVMPDQSQVNSRIQTWLTAGSLGSAASYAGAIVLDVETWQGLAAPGDQSAAATQAAKYVQLMGYLRNAMPLATLGYYGMNPRRNYFSALHYGLNDATWLAWQAENDWWQSVADVCDFTAPSCYYFYEQEGTQYENEFFTYVKGSISEAKRAKPNKPCYPYLLTACHNSNATWSGQFAQYRFMFKQLKVANDFADGGVLFAVGGFTWDSKLEWIRALADFVAQTPGKVSYF